MRRPEIGRWCAYLLLALVFAGAACADWLAPYPYERQFRDAANAPPSARFLLGTDELGRDRWSRLLHGSRVSLALAPAAALLSVGLAGLLGALAGGAAGICERSILGAADLTLSLPWILLLVTLRALLPLNASPALAVSMTFLILGVLGWAGPARVVRTGVGAILASEYYLAARSRGIGGARLLFGHALPNVRPVLAAQFWTAIPMFLLAEANLGMLGLGVPEPLPSWGSLLRELENQTAALAHPLANWWLLAPLGLVVAVVVSIQCCCPSEIRQ